MKYAISKTTIILLRKRMKQLNKQGKIPHNFSSLNEAAGYNSRLIASKAAHAITNRPYPEEELRKMIEVWPKGVYPTFEQMLLDAQMEVLEQDMKYIEGQIEIVRKVKESMPKK